VLWCSPARSDVHREVTFLTEQGERAFCDSALVVATSQFSIGETNRRKRAPCSI
jgi:hypothetical protein